MECHQLVMQVFSFVNQKGGCGKTTAAVNLSGALAARGRRVLLVDLDPQGHATLGLGCDPDEGPTSLEVLAGSCDIRAAITKAPGGIDLIPADLSLGEFEERAEHTLRPEQALSYALRGLSDLYDDVLLDCPPRADGVLTINALRASDTAILVVETGAFALQGAVKALSIFEEVRARDDSRFDMRVLATLFDRRTRFARDLLFALHARFGPVLFESVIRTSVRLREAAACGVPVQVLDKRSRATNDFAALAMECLIEQTDPSEVVSSVPTPLPGD
jgi:chromosome partitioning protein